MNIEITDTPLVFNTIEDLFDDFLDFISAVAVLVAALFILFH